MSTCKEIAKIIKSRLGDILTLRSRITQKEDESYVSEGDLLIQSIVFDYLSKYLTEYELISEEMAPFTDANWNIKGSYVVLDPIDGTENFISGLREWGVGISIFKKGVHQESCIYLPELNDIQITGMEIQKYNSRIIGLSSSLSKHDIVNLPELNSEYRIIGCSMYNTLSAVRGSFLFFENVKGVNCWDILPGLNLALEHNCTVRVDGEPYTGQMLFPVKKYKIHISNEKN
jgi:myo-inositol-1(or 4)-monophosphatase